MRLSIHHSTVYQYPHAVVNSVNEVWLRPVSDERQTCLSFSLTTMPASNPRPYTDYFGNTVYHFDVPEQHARLEIIADAEVETVPIDRDALLAGDDAPFEPLSPDEQDLWLDYLVETPLTAAGPAVRRLAIEVSRGQDTTAGVLRALAARVAGALRYEPGTTGVETPAEEALRQGAGVCQDYTHLFLSSCRRLGIPARYVSGYLCTTNGDGERQQSHAWPEALLPRAGWVEFDPTNRRMVDEQYVRVAIGRDYGDVPPVRGAYSGPSADGLDVSVYVVNDQQQQ
jgi:transglutaminase-like putative cysteine protease